jgi:ubiquinone/menaquinone biosynthesis C-methylase UbiE
MIADRFTGRAAEYERYRMRYPKAVMEVLRDRCELRPEYVIADIGAGTGMLAELFLEAGHMVIAVEPNAEMHAACGRLQQRYDTLLVRDASAEDTELPDQSVDMVVVGRAFHWFDQERALEEFERIMEPGGWVVLVTAHRVRRGSPEADEYDELLVEFGTDYALVRDRYRDWDGLKPFGEEYATFDVKLPGEERLTLEELIGQTQSLSVAPLPGHAKYDGMQQALRGYFMKWSRDGVLRFETECAVTGWKTPD